jgi:predicted dehydrogenase
VRPVRLLQLGLGGWGRNWVEEVTRATPGVRPVAWVDPDEAARAVAIAELSLPPARVFAGLDEACRAVEAEAALITVPLAAHAAATEAALRAGLHALVEKPFTDTLAEAAALVKLAEASDRVLMVNQNYRWFPAPRAACRLLVEGRIGQPIAAYLDFHFFFGTGYRYFFLEEPLLSDMAIHHFDSLRFVLDDEPVEVACQSWTEPGVPFHGRPAAVATIRFARGTMVSYRGSWLSRGPTTPYGGRWRIDGTGGTIELTWRGPFEQRDTMDEVVLHEPGRPARRVRLPRLACLDRRGALRDFARWLRTGQPPAGVSTAADNLRSLALMVAAIRSAQAGGAPVQVGALLREIDA